MQSKAQERARAVKLRKQGLSYSEIRQLVPVSQASLSLWLHSVVLSPKQQQRIQEKINANHKIGAANKHRQRLEKMEVLGREVEKELPAILTDPFFMFGLALYWAEGAKIKPWHEVVAVKFVNSDPELIVLMRLWLMEYGNKTQDDFKYSLHIHQSADSAEARKKWSELLGVEEAKIAITFKRHEVRGRHKHDDYIGLMSMYVCRSTWLNRRIELWARGAAKSLRSR